MELLPATEIAHRLSPWGDAAPSPYVLLQPGTTATLDVAFSYTHVPPGAFTFTGPAAGSPNFVLHLNVRGNDYYQNGIPGVTHSIEQTAAWLQAVRAALGVRTVRTIGASMGAYAALLFGELIGAEAIYAFSPVLRPGHLALGQKAAFRDIAPLPAGLGTRTVTTFGAYELSEYQFLLPCLEAGMDLARITLLANFHPGLLSLRLDALFGSADAVPAAMLATQTHRCGLDRHDVGLLAAAMATVARRDHAGACAVLGPLTRRDGANAGLLYRLGVHQALAGWPEAARVSLRRAGAVLRQVEQAAPGVLGPDADLKKRSVRDYAHLLGFAPLKRVHDLMDEVLPVPDGTPHG